MSDTPRTDGVLPSQSFIDETRLFDRHYYLPLIEHARQLERDLATERETMLHWQKRAERQWVKVSDRMPEQDQFCLWRGEDAKGYWYAMEYPGAFPPPLTMRGQADSWMPLPVKPSSGDSR